MTDRYIDFDETQIYGPYAAKHIRGMVVGLLPAFDKGLEHLAHEIEHATASVKTALEHARAAEKGVRRGSKGRQTALANGRDVLKRFSKHLDAHKDGTVDRETFFPGEGTVEGVGRSGAAVLLALNHIAIELGKKGTKVEAASKWQTELSAAAADLAPVLDHSDSAHTSRRQATPELDTARTGWLQVYRAARAGVECVLRLVGRLDLLPAVFHDLAVSPHAHVTEMPPTPPAAKASP